MQDAATHTATTEAPHQAAGFPPFKTETFPSQIFWLVVTFAFLFTVLWRLAGPRIQSVLAERRGKINDDIKTAELHRRDSEAASAAYDSALVAARGRAHAVAEENRKRLASEVDAAKTSADAEAHKASASAEARINAMREEAKAHIANAARDAAVTIVARLTGDTVSEADAAAAVKSVSGA
jgi:F-type H+-transporting ATPase subunit b